MSLEAVAAVVVAVLCTLLLLRRRRTRQLPSHQQLAVCPECGWKGVVSRYAGCCPSCNAVLGERKARRPGRPPST